MTTEEITHVGKRLEKVGAYDADAKAVIAVLDQVFAAPDAGEASLPLRAAPLFGPLSSEALARVGEQLALVRADEAREMARLHDALLADFKAKASTAPAPAAPIEPPKGALLVADFFHPTFPGAKLYVKQEGRDLGTDEKRRAPANARVRPGPGTAGTRLSEVAVLIPAAPAAPAQAPSPAAPSLAVLIAGSLGSPDQQGIATRLLEYAEKVGAGATSTVTQLAHAADRHVAMVVDASYGFHQRLQIEPVGYLHLERLSFFPAGIERGELTYSVPLSPAEEVNISHKEWSNTSEEFEKIVTDYIENYSEEGVTEKSEFTQSTNSQDQHSMGFNTGVTASGGYGPVTITASVGLNLADSATHSEQSARKH